MATTEIADEGASRVEIMRKGEGGETENGDGAGRKDDERRTLWKREGK